MYRGFTVQVELLWAVLQSGGHSETVGETPARCKAHPNAQCFLLQMLGALFNLVIPTEIQANGHI